GGPYRPCSSPLRYWTGQGWHALRVRAIGPTGLRGPAAIKHFCVKRRPSDATVFRGCRRREGDARMSRRFRFEPLILDSRFVCAALAIATMLVWLAYPAMSQGEGGEVRFCGMTHNGDGFELEAGDAPHPTSCSFARATYRAYRRSG